MSIQESEIKEIKSIIESILIVAAEPLSIEEIKETLESRWKITDQEVLSCLNEIKSNYLNEGRGFQIVEIAGKFQLCTAPKNAEWIKNYLQIINAEGLSKPSLETLAVIAYRQPITKAEVEAIRGVNVDGVIKKLSDKGLIKIRGRKEVLGHPFLYVTAEKFLEYFGLRSLDDLPQKEELTIKNERNNRESKEVATENRSN